MDKKFDTSKLEKISRDVCQKFGFDKVWFAQKLGKRISFLAGWGKEIFVKPPKVKISDNLYMFIEPEKPINPLEVKNYVVKLLK